ncbi:MAG: hypothetical protein ACK4K9_01840 [Bacteroidia bacterium]
MKKLIFILIIIIKVVKLNAQSNCLNTVYEADRLYNKANFNEAVALIEPCLINGILKEDLFDAYRILALCYQALANESKTDEHIRNMLKVNPDYQKYPNIDPVEFTKKVNTYKVEPVIYAGVFTGFNINGVILEKSYSAYAADQLYKPKTGYQVGAFADYYIFKKFFARTLIGLSRIQFNHYINNAGGWEQSMTETFGTRNINTSANVEIDLPYKLKALSGIGIGLQRIHSAYVFLESKNKENGSKQLSTKNAYDERKINQWHGMLNLGLEYALGNGYFGINMQYHPYFQNTIIEDKRMNDLNFIFNNQYVHDDVKLQNIFINFYYRIVLQNRIKKP